jgi:EmrB/QacA subfamily drug resistance transporter
VAQGDPGTAVGRRLRPEWVFALVAAGVVMSNLDTFVVNVALPQIDLHFHQTSLGPVSWVLDAYAVIFAAVLVPAGNLADRYGARPIYLTGIAIFSAGSLACSLAPGVWWLVGFRVAQAVGAALLVPASLALLLAAAPPDKRLLYVRGWTALSALGAALGPALGGLLTQASWRWVFLINVPIGAAVLTAGPGMLPRPAAKDAPARIDATGAVLLSAGIGAVALAVVESPTWGWSSGGVIGCLGGGLVVLAGFAVRSARHPSPVLPVALLRIPGFAPASLCNLLFAVPFAAMLLSIVLWAEQVWHWSALATGFAVAPGPLMVPAFALLVGPALLTRVGPGLVAAAGSVIFAAGIVWWIAAMHTRANYLHMLPGMLVTGVGVGLTLPTLIAAAVASLPPTSFSTGSAVVTMARQIGSVLGVAVLVAILDTTRHTRNAVAVFDHGWWFTAATAGLAAIASLTLTRKPSPSPPPRRSAPPEPSRPMTRARVGRIRWARLDSNQGPTDYESAALTN